jgi:hypothetical protein
MMAETLEKNKCLDLNAVLSGNFIEEHERAFLNMKLKYEYIKPVQQSKHAYYLIHMNGMHYLLNGVSSLVYKATLITSVSRMLVDQVIHKGLGEKQYNGYG